MLRTINEMTKDIIDEMMDSNEGLLTQKEIKFKVYYDVLALRYKHRIYTSFSGIQYKLEDMSIAKIDMLHTKLCVDKKHFPFKDEWLQLFKAKLQN